ncbi:MAG: DUF805 domain-containing protein [Alphaproteobacteria bacterium]|nr:DUF805 domain-containing protein [Alphaproteobacteria bacterium]
MNPIRLFGSFKGRIGRASFWFGMILLAAISPFSLATVLSDNPFEKALQVVHDFGLAGLGWSLLLLIGVAALMTKRLHDRDRSGVYAAAFYLPAAVAALLYFFGGQPWAANIAKWSTWITAFAGTAGVWFLVQLGFFPGTNGANKYGADPDAD